MYVPEIDSCPRNHPNWPEGPTKGLQSPEFADWDEWTRSCVTVNAAPAPVMKALIEQNCTLPGQSETNDARQSDKLSQCLWKRDKTNSRAVDRFWSRISHSARCSLGCSFRFCHSKLIVWVKFSNYFFWKRLSICAFYGDLYLVNSLQPTLVSLFISGTTCILLQSCLSIVC